MYVTCRKCGNQDESLWEHVYPITLATIHDYDWQKHQIITLRHQFSVMRTELTDFESGRWRYRVKCLDCKMLIREATTSPAIGITEHLEATKNHDVSTALKQEEKFTRYPRLSDRCYNETTEHYRDAMSRTGKGSWAAMNWVDKPHRLIYDLCGELEEIHQIISQTPDDDLSLSLPERIKRIVNAKSR